jgi:putative sigma-54 modulation protein
MKCEFTYIKVEGSENVEQHAETLLSKVEKYMTGPIKGHFTFSQEKFNHKVVLTITGKHMYYKAEAKDENFYSAIEYAIQKMQKQLMKKKSLVKNHKIKHPAKELNNLISLEDYRQMLLMRRKLG